MTVTVKLNPETETSLMTQARAKGLPLDRYIEGLLEQLAGPATHPMTPKGRETAFDDWVESLNAPTGIREEAFHRRNWYR